MAATIQWSAEFTDTFAGIANYGWVRRETFTLPSTATDRQIVTAAKAALGLTGSRCRRFSYSDGFELRPIGSLTVAFIIPAH